MAQAQQNMHLQQVKHIHSYDRACEQEKAHQVQQKAQEDLQAAQTAAQAAEQAAEDDKTRLRGMWAAAEDQKKELEAKVARAAGCLKAADDLKEAR